MSPETFRRILSLLPKHVKQLDFSHRGDPTMNPDFPDMVATAHEQGFVTDLYTNGYALDKYVDRLVETGLDILRVDLDGASKKSYERYRIGSDFERVRDNVRQLVAARRNSKGKSPKKIYLVCVVSSYNEDEIPAMQEMAKTLGVDGMLFKSAIMNYGAKYYRDQEVQDRMLPRNKSLWRAKRSDGFVCPFLWRGAILYNGDFIMCAADFEAAYLVGNILAENSYEKVFFGPKARAARREMLERKGLCRNCAVVGEDHYLRGISLEFGQK